MQLFATLLKAFVLKFDAQGIAMHNDLSFLRNTGRVLVTSWRIDNLIPGQANVLMSPCIIHIHMAPVSTR